MKNILVVVTGGTISSIITQNGIQPNDILKRPMLIDMLFKSIPSLENEICFNTISPVFTLSENMDLNQWEKVLLSLKITDLSKYYGIIFLHGTDTLAYFSNMISLFTSSLPKTCIVSSDKVLSDSSANGFFNFKKAVEIIMENDDDNGIFVPYQNSNGEMVVHKGYQIIQSEILTNDFYSINSVLPKQFSLSDFTGFKNKVLILQSFVGMNFSMIDFSSIDYVLLKSYHAATTNESEVMTISHRCRECNATLYIASSFSSETNKNYTSTNLLKNLGINYLDRLTLESGYAWLLMK